MADMFAAVVVVLTKALVRDTTSSVPVNTMSAKQRWLSSQASELYVATEQKP